MVRRELTDLVIGVNDGECEVAVEIDLRQTEVEKGSELLVAQVPAQAVSCPSSVRGGYTVRKCRDVDSSNKRRESPA